MFSFLWVLTQSISTTSTGSFEEPSAYTRENNLRNAVCISKQGFNCAFQSRCYIFQIHFFFCKQKEVCSVAVSFRCFLKHVFELKRELKISSSCLAVWHPFLSATLSMTFPPVFFLAVSRRLPFDTWWNYHQIITELSGIPAEKINNSKHLFILIFPHSFYEPLQQVSVALSRPRLRVLMVTCGSTNCPLLGAVTSLPGAADRELAARSRRALDLGSAVLFLALKSKQEFCRRTA